MHKITLVLFVFCSILALGCGGGDFTPGNGTADSGIGDAKPDKPHDANKPDTDAGDAKPDADAQAEDAKPDVLPEAEASIPEAGEEPDVESPDADAEVEADAEPPPDVIEEPAPTDCEKLGVIGKVTIIVRHDPAASIEAGIKVLAVMSKLTFNDASKNTNFETTCWALPGQKEFVCLPLGKNSLTVDVESGMIVEFEPGSTFPSVQITDGDGFCTTQNCPTGDFLVCSGKEKEPVCRVKDGVWNPPQAKATGPWGITTIKCTFQ